MATSVTETERKYEAPSDASLPDLTNITGVATGPEVFDLEATYFDTDDYRLARAGVTLRRRVGGDDEGWHLKLPAGEDTRQEVRAPLGRAVKHPPKDLSSLVRAHTRGSGLAPIAEIRTNRRRWQLTNNNGQLLAEVVDDVVTAQTMGSSTTTTSWRESPSLRSALSMPVALLMPAGSTMTALRLQITCNSKPSSATTSWTVTR